MKILNMNAIHLFNINNNNINDSFTASVHAMTTTTTSYILSTIEPQNVNTMSNLDDNDRSNDHKMIKLNTDTSPSLVNLSSLSKSLDMERNLMVNLGECVIAIHTYIHNN